MLYVGGRETFDHASTPVGASLESNVACGQPVDSCVKAVYFVEHSVQKKKGWLDGKDQGRMKKADVSRISLAILSHHPQEKGLITVNGYLILETMKNEYC